MLTALIGFIALAASFARSASGIAEERVANVIVGGAFGLIAVALTDMVWQRVVRKGASPSHPTKA